MGVFQYLLLLLLPFALGFPDKPHYRIRPKSEEYVPTFFSSIGDSKKELKCPENERYSWCDGHCQRSCANLKNPAQCLDDCIPGCICNAGYVRDADGKCIPIDLCSSLGVESSKEDEFCPPNEKFSPCFAHCQKNCSNWSDPTVQCPKMCVPGCVCNNGMLRGPHGDCIRPRQCPPRQTLRTVLSWECPRDEHFEVCSAQCQKDCFNWNNEESACPMICVPGCVCDREFVRGQSGKCVLPETCSLQNKNLKRKTKKNQFLIRSNPCPEGEYRSTFRSIGRSNVYCTSGNGLVAYCPPTYFKQCVCDRGLVRGGDNRCLDRRLQPNVNEVYFLHGVYSNADKESTDNENNINQKSYDDTEEFSGFGEISFTKNVGGFVLSSDEQTTLQITPTDGATIRSRENTKLSFPSDQPNLETYRQNSNANSYGCPNTQTCTRWCQETSLGSKGICTGHFKLFCLCSNS